MNKNPRKHFLVFMNLMMFMFLNCFSPLTHALDFYSQHAQGWHWYRATPQTIHRMNVKNALKNEKSKENKTASLDPLQQMQVLHRILNRSLDRAILNPTKRNVRAYMVLQNQVTQRASVFTARWKEILLQNPRLDYSILHPTSSLGRQIYLKQYRAQENKIIRHFASHQGLFFFYRGDCPYCHRFAPILKAFTERYGIHVIPISVGGGFLAEFPESRIDQGQAALLHVSVYPSLFAVNPKTRKIIPVAYGLLSEEALRNRILNVVTHFQNASFQNLSWVDAETSGRNSS